MMIRYGVSNDDALAVCERLPETFIEFLAERASASDVSPAHGAIWASRAVKTPEKHDAPHAGAGAA